MSSTQKAVRELHAGDILTLAELEAIPARRYGKVVRVEKPHKGSDGRSTLIVAVQYLLDPDDMVSVTTNDDWTTAPSA